MKCPHCGCSTEPDTYCEWCERLITRAAEDVVVKAHEALAELRNIAESESAEPLEWIDQQVESVSAALPPLPQKKEDAP